MSERRWIAVPGPQLVLLQIGRMQHRLLGEIAHPAAIAPEQHHEALLQEAGFELLVHLRHHIVDLVPVAEQHRHVLQRGDRAVDLGQADHRDHRSVELAHAHAPDHVDLPALGAVGVDGERAAPALRLLPALGHLLHGAVIARALRHQRAQADAHGFLRQGGRHCAQRAGGGQAAEKSQTTASLHDHSFVILQSVRRFAKAASVPAAA